MAEDWSFKADFGMAPSYNNAYLNQAGLFEVSYNPGSGRVWKDEDGKTPSRTNTGCTRLNMQFTVVKTGLCAAGPQDGSTTSDNFNRADSNLSDQGAREKANRDAIGFFRAHLESMGAIREKLDEKGKEKQIGESWYADAKGSNGVAAGKPRVGYIEFVPKDESMGRPNAKTTWLTKEQYDKKVAAGVMPGGAAKPAGGSGKGKADPDVELEEDGKGAAGAESAKAGGGTTRKRAGKAATEAKSESKASEPESKADSGDPLDAIDDL